MTFVGRVRENQTTRDNLMLVSLLSTQCNLEKLQSLHAEVENNLKFPLHMDYLVLFKALFTVNLKKPPPGSSQVPPNVDPTSALEL